MAIDIQGYGVPETPYREYSGMRDLVQAAWRNRMYQYQIQKQKELDQWKKLNLINDLTDLSKYKTGSDVADAIGNTLMGGVYQKYTQNADKMNPFELQSGIQKDMGSIFNGMQGVRDELTTADKQSQALKQAFPNLDTASLYNDMRQDIVHRHLNDQATDFRNPMEIQQSKMQLDNPEFLSGYLKNTKALDEAIQNPKGLDATTVATGTPESNTEFSAKVPPWMQPNYSDQMLQKGGGFLPHGFVPQLSIKSETLPTDFLPALQGNKRKIVTSDVHQNMLGQYPLETIQGTRQMFPNYDQMSDAEKELAQRDFLYNKISSLDKSQFGYKTSKTPSAALLKFYQGGNESAAQLNVNDIYKRIGKSLEDREQQGQSFLPVSLLDPDAKDVIMKQAQQKNKDYTQDDLQIIRGNDNSVRVFDKNGEFVNFIPRVATNIKSQPSVKEKKEVIRMGNEPQVAPQPQKSKGRLDDLK